MIEIRYIERTNFELEPYIRTIRRYAKGLTHPMVISFDNRLKNYYGDYSFDGKKHVIRISPSQHKDRDKKEQLYQLLKTTLHEIKHYRQWRKLKHAFWSEKYAMGGDNNPTEVEARAYEDTYIDHALRFYNRCKAEPKGVTRESC